MTAITLNRGEAVQIPFTITDPNNGLVGKRVTYSISVAAGGVRVLRKVGGLPGSTADVTISSQSAGSISGTINIAVTDYATLSDSKYVASLWVDDNVGNDRCVTQGVLDTITIQPTVARLA